MLGVANGEIRRHGGRVASERGHLDQAQRGDAGGPVVRDLNGRVTDGDTCFTSRMNEKARTRAVNDLGASNRSRAVLDFDGHGGVDTFCWTETGAVAGATTASGCQEPP